MALLISVIIYSIWFASPKLSSEYHRINISSGETGEEITITDESEVQNIVQIFNESISNNSSGTKIKTYGYTYRISFDKSILNDTFIIYSRDSIWKSTLFGMLNVKYDIDESFIKTIEELFKI